MPAKYAPGPWQLDVRAKHRFCSSTGEKLKDYMSVYINDSKGNFIGVASDYEDNYLENARLLAAAPSLLEALKACVSELGQYDMANDPDGIMERYRQSTISAAEKAIDMAEGGSNVG